VKVDEEFGFADFWEGTARLMFLIEERKDRFASREIGMRCRETTIARVRELQRSVE
jgi:hypothetical protein